MEKEITDFISKLKNSDKLIIVEGIKDKKALNSIGVNNFIVMLSKKPIFAVIEDVAKVANQVIILTDFDKKGKELYGKLNSGLQKLGVKVDRYFREWLQRNTKLSHIEGIDTYIKKLQS